MAAAGGTSGRSTPAPLRVGTRGSALATTQTRTVVDRLSQLIGAPAQTVRIRTDGDVLTGSLASLGGTGVFVTALRQALFDGRCDVAVHSLKDLPTAPVPELRLVTPARQDPRDALCARDGLRLSDLPAGARVGTGSPRRVAQLLAARPDVEVVDIRGNVDTRLARVHGPQADLDAVILAQAGLARLGRLDAVSQTLDVATMAPAPGQGALAVEVRRAVLDDPEVRAAFDALDDRTTHLAVTAERAVLARLEAGCAAPVGAHAEVSEGRLTLYAVVARTDGTEALRRTASAPVAAGDDDLAGAADSGGTDAAGGFDRDIEQARRLGERMADDLLGDGAADIAEVGPAER